MQLSLMESARLQWQRRAMRISAAALIIAAIANAPADAARSDSVGGFIWQTLGTATYERADADLNGDGRQESFVYVTDQTYCGSGGCALLVLSPHGRGYRIVMRATVTQLPIALLGSTTRGWRDIGVTVRGGGITRSYMARMRFDGRRYPSNPTVAPAIPLMRPAGMVLIGARNLP